MAITSVKIHPAIGVARVGNSPDDFFIGPERLWDPVDPAGGFKDAECRVKRQAARFRVYAYHDDGTIDELTAAEADLSWTVHLASKKAITRNVGTPAADLTIDPGSRTLNGPNQRQEFDNGTIRLPGASAVTVPLGEARTDDDGHLLVLGGFGTSASPTGNTISSFLNNAGWFDDISDGPVTAKIKLHSTGDEYDAVGAWVIVAPPKFAPQLDNVITLYDRVFQMGVSQGWLAGPAVPSYTTDIHPILERARMQKWVIDTFGAHTWVDPVYDAPIRTTIFNRLANPAGGGGNMPQLNSATVTPTQYAVMQAWRDDNFTRDWAGAPTPGQITPEELDHAALINCVGAAFFPGIEAGGIAAIPVIDASKYVGAVDPMRLNHAALGPGDMSEFMALPWQADFKACGSNWWPVPRPNDVLPEGTTTPQSWDRDVGSMLEMVSEWHTLGFIVKQGDQYVEVDRCDTTFITLLTPHLNFQDVPQGPMGMARQASLAIAFEVRSTGGPVTLEVQAGESPTHPRLTMAVVSDTEGPTVGNQIATARLWVTYTTGPAIETITDDVTVRHLASGRSWTVTISANTVERKKAAVALVLDRSGSMTEDRGDGQSKHESLKQAASVFVDVMLQDDGVGIARYNQDGQQVQQVTPLGAADDLAHPARQDTKNVVNGPQFNPDGATSIGDGIFEGRQILNAAPTDYAVKSLVVLTDGKENRARWISEVSAEINELTYAIGLGTPQNTSAPALQTISGNNGGYLLVTGAITGDNQFVLQKYFLQILAGISNAEVVLDPDGTLVPGHEQRIPFLLTEADAGVDVILLTPYPHVVDFRVQTPNGFILEPWRAMAEPTMLWSRSRDVAYYRFSLPTELFHARFDHAGTWHGLLTVGKPRETRPREPEGARDPDRVREFIRPLVSLRELGDVAPLESAEVLRRIPPRTGRDPQLALVGHDVAVATVGPSRRTLPYSLLVHSYSNLSLRASVQQSSYDVGAKVRVHASLAESGVPMRPGSYVLAEIARPDGSSGPVVLEEGEPGQFDGSFTAKLAGVYRVRVRVSGRSRAGHPFEREQTLTAAVWQGGGRASDPDHAGGGPLVRWIKERDEKLCQLLECLTSDGLISREVEKRLREMGVDADNLRKCLRSYCTHEDSQDDS